MGSTFAVKNGSIRTHDYGLIYSHNGDCGARVWLADSGQNICIPFFEDNFLGRPVVLIPLNIDKTALKEMEDKYYVPGKAKPQINTADVTSPDSKVVSGYLKKMNKKQTFKKDISGFNCEKDEKAKFSWDKNLPAFCLIYESTFWFMNVTTYQSVKAKSAKIGKVWILRPDQTFDVESSSDWAAGI